MGDKGVRPQFQNPTGMVNNALQAGDNGVNVADIIRRQRETQAFNPALAAGPQPTGNGPWIGWKTGANDDALRLLEEQRLAAAMRVPSRDMPTETANVTDIVRNVANGGITAAAANRMTGAALGTGPQYYKAPGPFGATYSAPYAPAGSTPASPGLPPKWWDRGIPQDGRTQGPQSPSWLSRYGGNSLLPGGAAPSQTGGPQLGRK